MAAEGGRAYITIINESHNFALGKGVFLATYLNIAHITRDAVRYKYHELIPVEQTLAFCSDSLYLYAL